MNSAKIRTQTVGDINGKLINLISNTVLRIAVQLKLVISKSMGPEKILRVIRSSS